VRELTLRVVDDLGSVNAASWNALDHGPSPFTEYGFLRALELSGSVGPESGWQPVYLLIEEPFESGESALHSAHTNESEKEKKEKEKEKERGRLVGAVAAYVKTHSYGEYIFDWSWARASQQAGLPYYPKLVIAAPMTPATGRRLLIHPDVQRAPVVAALCAGVRGAAQATDCKSIHWLFCSADEQQELATHGFAPRASFQYHWKNHDYGCFDDFLGTLTSRKRKQLRRERARAQATVDDLQFVGGHELTAAELHALDGFYRRTTVEHGGSEYLRPGFFQHLMQLQGQRVQVARVRKDDQMIAGALFFQTPTALYGRYWGCSTEIDLLHFETTIYAGIERCIAADIPLFEAGAQGQHKLRRGFLPCPTYSAHWLAHEGFHQAVVGFLREETVALAAGMLELESASPYRAEVLAGFHGHAPTSK